MWIWQIYENIILLQSIPGLGWLSSIVIMTHIEDIKRCRNTDHLSSYIGLIPNNHSSGEKNVLDGLLLEEWLR